MPYVYYAQAGPGGPVKIGVAKRPLDRIAVLQTANHAPLVLLAIEPGDRVLEGKRHAQFVRLRINHEWFRPGVDLMAHITTLQDMEPRKEWTAEALRQLAARMRRIADQADAEAFAKELEKRAMPSPRKPPTRRPRKKKLTKA